jgi:protein-S-isoprenylcysteine O-methyltransferase Ste14
MKRKIMPPTYFMVLLVLSLLFYFVFTKSKTTVKPHEIPTSLEISGPFRISRHPMYLGMAAILLGVAIVLGSLLSFIFFWDF